MTTLVIKELTAFKDALRRDIIADGISQRTPPTDDKFLKSVIDYGNDYLERAFSDPINRDAVLWFDIHFSDPAVIGMTWCRNPRVPMDLKSGMRFFWRMWSEVAPGAEILTLEQMQTEFAAYVVAGGTK